MSKETDEEYRKRQHQRKARALQKETGMKYTAALRQVQAEEAEAEDERDL